MCSRVSRITLDDGRSWEVPHRAFDGPKAIRASLRVNCEAAANARDEEIEIKESDEGAEVIYVLGSRVGTVE